MNLSILRISAATLFWMGCGPLSVHDPANTQVAASLDINPVCASADRGTDPTAGDFLVQQVCLAASGGLTADDPCNCPSGTSARKLQIGEWLPYHKHDRPQPGAEGGFQVSDAFPLSTDDGTLRVLKTMLFRGSQGADGNLSWNTTAGGYDVYIANGDYVSGMGTYDQTGGFQPMWAPASGQSYGCSLLDSWVYFPKGTTDVTQQAYAEPYISIEPSCSTQSQADFYGTTQIGYGQALTIWNKGSATFSDDAVHGTPGKVMDAITSFHFDNSTFDASSGIEVFYFTQVYGPTRWEHWTSAALSPVMDSVTCNGATEATFGSTTFIRDDCRDWSFVEPAVGGGWDPSTWHVDPLFRSSQNLLQNTHFSSSLGIDPWLRSAWNTGDVPNWTYDTSLYNPQFSHNLAPLAFSCGANGCGDGIYQEIAIGSPADVDMKFGALLWSSADSGAFADIAIYQEAADGTIIDQSHLSLQPSTTRQFYAGTFHQWGSTAVIRFFVTPQTPGAGYHMMDPWVSHL
jgi:hypothetical protein